MARANSSSRGPARAVPGQKRRPPGPVALGEALDQYLKQSGILRRLGDREVLDAWNRAVGEDLARRAWAVRFRRGELLVEVSSSAHLHELRGFTGEAFRVKTNQLLGDERILKVAFKLAGR